MIPELPRLDPYISPLIFGSMWAVIFFLSIAISNNKFVENIHADVPLRAVPAGITVYLVIEADSSLLPGAVGFVLTYVLIEALKHISSSGTDVDPKHQ